MTKTDKKVHNLPCPVCKAVNPVRRENARIKCGGCGAMLRAVRVKRNNSG